MSAPVPFGVWRNGDKIAAFAELQPAKCYAAKESRKHQCQTGVWAAGKAIAAYSNGYQVHTKTGRILMNVSAQEASRQPTKKEVAR